MQIRSCAGIWAIASAVTAVAAGVLLRVMTLGPAARLGLSVAPVVPMGVFCLLAIRIIRGFDELQTRIHLEGALYGLLGTALVTMTGGLLVRGGFLPPVSLAAAWPWLWIAAFLLWGVGTVVAGARYR